MASVIPDWLMGWNISTVTVRYQVAAATGILGNGSSAVRTLTGVIDGIDYDGEDMDEEIAPLTSRFENSVSLLVNEKVTLMEIAALNSTTGGFLRATHRNGEAGGDFIIVTFARNLNSVALKGTMGELGLSVREGKSVHTLEVAFADIFDNTTPPAVPEANPVYA